jgi:hypothetical protein
MSYRFAVAAVAALSAASLACGGSSAPSGIDDALGDIELQEGQGLLEGTVHFVGVPCPLIYPPRPPCDGLYPDYEVIVYRSDGDSEAARARSDEHGLYQVALADGEYVIFTQAGLYETLRERNEARITAGDTTRLDLVVDTGIR